MKLTNHIRACQAFKLNFNGLNMPSKDERDFFFLLFYILRRRQRHLNEYSISWKRKKPFL